MVKQVARNLLVIGVMYLFASVTTGQSYDLAFSTFFDGSAGKGIRDAKVDSLGTYTWQVQRALWTFLRRMGPMTSKSTPVWE